MITEQVEKIEEAVVEYDIDAATVAGWAVENAEASERKARGRVSKTVTALAQAREGRRIPRKITCGYGAKYGRDAAVQLWTEILEDRLARRVNDLAWSAHHLEHVRAAAAQVS